MNVTQQQQKQRWWWLIIIIIVDGREWRVNRPYGTCVGGRIVFKAKNSPLCCSIGDISAGRLLLSGGCCGAPVPAASQRLPRKHRWRMKGAHTKSVNLRQQLAIETTDEFDPSLRLTPFFVSGLPALLHRVFPGLDSGDSHICFPQLGGHKEGAELLLVFYCGEDYTDTPRNTHTVCVRHLGGSWREEDDEMCRNILLLQGRCMDGEPGKTFFSYSICFSWIGSMSCHFILLPKGAFILYNPIYLTCNVTLM